MDAVPAPLAAFTTELITDKVGINPITGDVWYWTGGISGTMIKVGTVTPTVFTEEKVSGHG